jgi:site-specific DNA-methyltransferase (adenine-specific)
MVKIQSAKRRFMKSIEIDQIYHGDCLEMLTHISDGSIDLVLADLPFGVTKRHWDCEIDYAELWKHYRRIIKSNGVIALFAH